MKALSRRTVLRGAGGVAISLPFLDIMGRVERASAQAKPGYSASGAPLRFFVFFSPNGTIPSAWAPTGGLNDWTLSRILKPLERHKAQLNVIQGVDQQGGGGDGHQNGMGGMLTGEMLNAGPFMGGDGGTAGWANGISVDQHIAQVIGTQTKFRSLELSVQSGSNGDNWNRMSYAAPDQPVPPEQSPYVAFDRIFTGFTPSGTGPTAADQLLVQRRKEVLGAAMEDYISLNKRLGQADREKLDAHLTAIRDIESRLNVPAATSSSATASCAVPSLGTPLDVKKNENFPVVGKLQMDLAAMALICDQTRVASLMFNRSVGGATFSWLNAGITRGHHDMSHDGDDVADTVEKLTLINIWYAEQFAYFLDLLAKVPEGTGTMLDNSLVLWCNELAKGNAHSRTDAAYVLAGGAGGNLKTNRYMQFSGNVPHNNLLLSLVNAMGIPDSSFGKADWCTGPLSGLV
ncbi:MAG: DUF1552 domain-containing protein [Polyangiaceae bacterium]|nr:DUF1552 domain-containing protein [Polyangiaceae bacterium]